LIGLLNIPHRLTAGKKPAVTPRMPPRAETVSLADLAAAGICVRPSELCAIVRALALQLSRGEIPGVPSPQVVRLSADGAVLVEGPVAAGGSAVVRTAQLLESLLPGIHATPERRVPGALRLAIARALGSVDLPPYPSIEAFADALGRFAELDASVVARDLYLAWASATDAGELAGGAAESACSLAIPTPGAGGDLTVSDIRRARRATGLTLAQIEERSRIPIGLLRQLEWGYLANWPAGQYGRVQLVRYARAAGLDVDIVVSTIAPLLKDEETVVDGEVVADTSSGEPSPFTLPQRIERVRAGDVVLVRAEPVSSGRPRSRLLPALAAAALLTVAIGSAIWSQRTSREAANGTPLPAASHPAEAQNVPARSVDAPRAPSSPPRSTAPLASPAVQARPVALSADDDPTYSPAFATEGSAMFYHAQGGSDSALMRADMSSGGAILRITRIVDDNSRNFHARPSPDGSRIAFDSDRDGERAVYVANADGTGVTRVTGDGYAAVPSWSPDGRTLIVVRAETDRSKVWNLWRVDLESGELRRLTNHTYGQPWGASWFPDGKRIAYSHEDRIVVMDLAGASRRIYRSPKPGRLLRTPAVSPDGKRMIFQVFRDGAWVLELRDGSMRKVLADPTAEEFTWSPDGRQVAYHSRRTGAWGVWLMHAR
jgi:hypothetical protein